MLKIILIIVAVVIVVFVIVVAMRPDNFTVTRAATIPAPPEAVFAQVNDLHKWQDWSPWAKMDPTAKISYQGPVSGPGASFSWAGNGKVGEGSMTISESRSNELVKFDLAFLKPFKANNVAEFTFKPDGNQTVVTWSMSGKNNFLFKAVGLFMDCDKMVGPDFEKGLANLADVVKAAQKQ